jgi:hypothetical protein
VLGVGQPFPSLVDPTDVTKGINLKFLGELACCLSRTGNVSIAQLPRMQVFFCPCGA